MFVGSRIGFFAAIFSIIVFVAPALALTRQDIIYCESESGDPDRSIAACTKILEELSLPPKDRAGILANRGSFYVIKGDLDSAMADFDASLRIAPDAITHNSRGNVLLRRGDLDGALAEYNEAIRLNPRNNKAYSSRGKVWRLKGDLDRALADQDQQIRVNPKDPYPYLARGDTYRYLGDFPRALADLDRAASLTVDSSAPFTSRGLTYEKMGDLARARAEFEKAVTARNPYRTDLDLSALEVARARLAALDSGGEEPVIPNVPLHSGATSIPTHAVAIPALHATASRVSQGRRVALVIGNSAYANAPSLKNPTQDTAVIAASLKNIGFEVTLVNDVSREMMVNALRDFANEAAKSDWGMVYYAGHGVEVGGVNYLIPVDAKISGDRDIQFEGVPLSQVLSAAEAKKITLVVLDACRDNPFTALKTAAVQPSTPNGAPRSAMPGTRSASGRGLAEVKVHGATLVVYAAKDGQVALDGDGGNSPFATAMVQRIATPGVEINKIFRLVRDDVMETTAGRQEPYTYGSLPGNEDFYFVAR